MRIIVARMVLLCMAPALMMTAAPYASSRAADTPAKTVSGSVSQTFDKAASQIKVDIGAPLGERVLKVAALADKELLAKAEVADLVKIEVDDPDGPQTITKVDRIDRPVGRMERIIALGISFGLLLLLAALVTGWKPQNFLIGTDNRYSNSKCQIALWFGAVGTVYLGALGLQFWLLGADFIGGVGLPTNLVVLTGLSAFTFGGAKAITVKKVADAAAAAQPGAPPAKQAAAKANFPEDLVQNDTGQFDIGDFQMILVVLAAVIIFALSVFHFLSTLQLASPVTLPDADTTLLSGFGLGQGAYLLKKAASSAGDG